MQNKKRSYDILLGSFVALGLLALLVLVFLIGKERRLFDRTVSLQAHFPNVAGLAVGADVLLSGRVVGRVKDIIFPDQSRQGWSDMTVAMEISHQYTPWIREDSIARIDSKGLLGDKLINISIGSMEFKEVSAGGMLKSLPPLDLNKALEKAASLLEGVGEAVGEAQSFLKEIGTKDNQKSLSSSINSVSNILHKIETGHGVLHTLIYDDKAGQAAKKSVMGLADSLRGFQTAGEELSIILKEIKEGKGIAHDLIFADDSGQFLRSLNKAAADIESLTHDVKNGKGSLGLLLTDPSIYNELYGLIGNLRRNRLLKAVIRHNVSQTEKIGAE